MSKEDIIAMATEAGLNSYRIAPGEALAVWERFAALVAAKEREECAQVCESRVTPGTGSVAILGGAADAIRARSNHVTQSPHAPRQASAPP